MRKLKTNCKYGHDLTIKENLLNETRRCKICVLEYQKQIKRNKRRLAGITERGKQTSCKNGHPLIPGNFKGKTRNCLTCHREQQKNRDRKRGIPPKIYLTREQKLNNRVRWEQTRRARKAEKFVEVVDPATLFKRDNGICGICNENILDKFEVDHIIPLSVGGEHSYKNTQAAHPTCNRKKWANINFLFNNSKSPKI